MLRRIGSLTGHGLAATDGEIGHCRDFLFDDRDWVTRYLVADTGGWLSGRKVLISPLALGTPDWGAGRLPIDLTRRQIEECPPLDEHAPVSREYEIAYHDYLALPFYRVGSKLWGMHPDPAGVVTPAPAAAEPPPADQIVKEGHLRSCAEVHGYLLRTGDGGSEAVDDFLIDDTTWAIRFLVADTHRWLPGRQVLVPTRAIASVDWVEREIHTDLTVEAIKASPAYDPTRPVDAEFERRLDDHYGTG
ncbi:hypothetical protein Thimo_2169 [Thioflavicoccus mobilis 8321]|uniref:PRC-barrel domain-containing protein n=1 Tax=Thioflavicoccus mobilis 8321 TaxID=765912 RepID=L0GYL5_9GAMM|nr:hypothetical protein [Thioflavicoccus mobilis]AGA90917.1 hypothetical protein Thimo_2169 [Thioflavicoccus mobilis 8321]